MLSLARSKFTAFIPLRLLVLSEINLVGKNETMQANESAIETIYWLVFNGRLQ